ncbi:MAG: SMC-Scp complex subunit ScpB [Pirellulales bacterium]|nr:SMC-Scp complex subunit ScpB [Pirellulales bacterium]
MPFSPEPHEHEGISLEELRDAFARAMGNGTRATPGAPELDREGDDAAADVADEEFGTGLPEEPVPSKEPSAPESASGSDDCPINPSTILEAMLFVGDRNNEPLTAARAVELMRGVELAEIPALVEELNRGYMASGCVYRVVSEGAGYRLALTPEFYPIRDKFYGRVREARLSQAAIDVLAIVAYQQPLTAEEVSRLRGTPCSHILSQLVRRRLLRIERTDEKPRITHYYTTERFLEVFKLQSLEDLPQSEELERR